MNKHKICHILLIDKTTVFKVSVSYVIVTIVQLKNLIETIVNIVKYFKYCTVLNISERLLCISILTQF